MISRRKALESLGTLGAAAAALVTTTTASLRRARAFGEGSEGGFEAKVLLAGGTLGAARATAPARWSAELEQRTSAPVRFHPRSVKATDTTLLDEPFVYWSSTTGLNALTGAEIAGLRQFFALGGLMVVDDAEPDVGAFGRDARRELARVLPDVAPVVIPNDHVLYRSFYLLKPGRPYGRVAGPAVAEGILRAGELRVIFLRHDLGGALARNALGTFEMSVEPDDGVHRERAIRFAVNIAMYALTTNYKDDAVHAPYLLKRKATP